MSERIEIGVRVVKARNIGFSMPRGHPNGTRLGERGVVAANPQMRWHRGLKRFETCCVVSWDSGTSNWIPVRCLDPVDNDADFKTFMDRVMKPVNLNQPVAA